MPREFILDGPAMMVQVGERSITIIRNDGETPMEFLFQQLKVGELSRLLKAYHHAGISLGSIIDGGAGDGDTAIKMLPYLDRGEEIFAYEPFPGNHRFFEGIDTRIRLIPKALSNAAETKTLSVPSVVAEESAWGRLGMAGYSSAGHLVEGEPNGEHDLRIPCVAADTDVERDIGFVKLDLQGGELRALQGMTRILHSAAFAWIEFLYGRNDPNPVYDFMIQNDYLILDTGISV